MSGFSCDTGASVLFTVDEDPDLAGALAFETDNTLAVDPDGAFTTE